MEYSKSQLAIALSKLDVFSSPKPGLEQYPTDSEIAAEVLWQAGMLGDIKGLTIADLGCGTGILGIGALLLGAKKVFFVDTDTAAMAVLGNNLKRTGIKKEQFSSSAAVSMRRRNDRMNTSDRGMSCFRIEDSVTIRKSTGFSNLTGMSDIDRNIERRASRGAAGGIAVIVNKDIADFEESVDVVIQNPPFGTRERHADREFLEKAITLAGTIYSFHKTATSGFVLKFASDNGFDVTRRWDFAFPLKQTLKFHKRKIQRIEVTCFRLSETHHTKRHKT
ncbi:MAG: METTL5 family protein [Nanoarchaeota archaeon]|nr:METTL5 family protein [Nanoarchaeota archaeon]